MPARTTRLPRLEDHDLNTSTVRAQRRDGRVRHGRNGHLESQRLACLVHCERNVPGAPLRLAVPMGSKGREGMSVPRGRSSFSARAGRRVRVSVVRPLLLAAAIGVLWAARPRGPLLPLDLTAPLTVDRVERLLEAAAWVALVVLAALLLARSLQRGQADRNAPDLRTTTAKGGSPRQDPPAAAPTAAFATAARLTVSAWEAGQRADSGSADRRPARQSGGTLQHSSESRTSSEACAVESTQVLALGPLTITSADGSAPIVRAATAEFVAYLALHREGAARDELLEALWPDTDPKRSRQRLWQSVSEARRLLGPALDRERERYRLDRSRVTIDLDRFEALMAEAERAPPAARRTLLEQAFALVRGGVLAGADYPWAEGETRRLHARLVQLAERVGRERLGADDAAGALAAAERGLALEPFDEALWRLAMEAEARLGLRQALTRRYETLRGLLLERLGVEPERDTRILYRQLLAQP